jgi:hypothetical protein
LRPDEIGILSGDKLEEGVAVRTVIKVDIPLPIWTPEPNLTDRHWLVDERIGPSVVRKPVRKPITYPSANEIAFR